MTKCLGAFSAAHKGNIAICWSLLHQTTQDFACLSSIRDTSIQTEKLHLRLKRRTEPSHRSEAGDEQDHSASPVVHIQALGLLVKQSAPLNKGPYQAI